MKFIIRWVTAWLTGIVVGGCLVLLAIGLGLFKDEKIGLLVLPVILLLTFGSVWLVVRKVNQWIERRQ